MVIRELRSSSRPALLHPLARLALVALAAPAALLPAGCGESPTTTSGGGSATTTVTTTGEGGTAGNTTASTAGSGGEGGSGGQGTTSTTGTTGTTGTSSNPPFQLEAHTALTPEGALALTTSLPALVADCLSAPFEGTPCADLDGDALADAWEDLVLDRFRPLLRLDEAESLVGDPSFVVSDVGRVALVSASPLRVRAFVMIGYSKDFGSCGFTSHNGDSERVALDLAASPAAPGADPAPGNVVVLAAYTAAHEGTGPATDHGKLFQGAALAELVHEDDPATSEPRWMVFPSADKHATYATIEICEGISIFPCFDEDCAPDGVPDPASFDVLPPVVNAGEEASPLVTDLTAIGFPGDDAWAEQDFCGGLGGGGCSAPVRDKLLADPF